ncbi:dihydroorotase [Candidatus Woesearchaeota archaeon]|nr:dihydroorotase [Candidatus Woesearchaeota archaeon]
MDVLLHSGMVYSSVAGDFIRADVRIHEDKVVDISLGILPRAWEKVVDCSGKHILPGLIDVHVHFREPGATHKEDFLSGSKAAAAGGVTTFLDMPNNSTPTTTRERLEEKRNLAKAKSIVNYGFYILGCEENANDLAEFDDVAGIKVYLGSSTGNYLTDDLGVFAIILQNAKRPVVVHAENEGLLRYFAAKYREGQLHHKMRDNLCAAVSVAESALVARHFAKSFHIAHLSTKEELALLRLFKTPLITCEVSPHHLFLNEEFFCSHGAYGKMNPPLRYNADQLALWEGIREGLVDMIATDHAPHTHEEKQKNVMEAPCGVPGVQTMLPLLLQAVSDGRLELRDVVRLCVINPAKKFGIKDRGVIKEDGFADLCIVDLSKEEIILRETQHSRCGWTPFEGMITKGAVVMTVVNGNIVYQDGMFFEDVKGKEVEYEGVK